MSNTDIADTKGLMQFLKDQGEKFSKVQSVKEMQFAAECLFAKQHLTKNEYVYKAALANPASLQAAILNVAAIGISLNPAQAHAYLVPRDNSICLDISYRGLVKLATDCKAIKDCKSVLVYENDTFLWKGVYEMPQHHADPFSKERGDIVGAYNIARMADGSVMVDTVDAEYIAKVEGTSKARSGPWKTWREEMILKTATRHASKSWPQTEDRERFDRAVELLDAQEGMAFTIEEQNHYMGMLRDQRCLEFYLWCRQAPEDKVIALYNSFEPGQKVKQKELADRTLAKGRDLAESVYQEWVELVAKGDEAGAEQIREEWSEADWNEILLAGGDRQEVANG